MAKTKAFAIDEIQYDCKFEINACYRKVNCI